MKAKKKFDFFTPPIFFFSMSEPKHVSQSKLKKFMKNIIINITQVENDMDIHTSKLKYILIQKNETEWISSLNHFHNLLRKKRCFTNYFKAMKRLYQEQINHSKDIL